MTRGGALSIVIALSIAACTVTDKIVNGAIPPPPDVASPPSDALKTPSGLVSRVLRAGHGSTRPHPHAHVVVHYTGWTSDGEMFDSSVVRGRPQAFDVEDVIPGWAEGLQLMVAGEKRRFWIPANLAFDSVNRPGAPRGPLVFDIELLEVDS